MEIKKIVKAKSIEKSKIFIKRVKKIRFKVI